MTPLRQRMLEDLRIRNYSPRTIGAYVQCISAFARHFGKSPERLRPEHIRDYQRYLVEERKVSWSRFIQVVCALRFFYRITLGRDWMINHIPHPKRQQTLPVVLSHEEVLMFLAAVKNLKHRTALQTMYGAGLRISEALGLRVDDIDSQRGVIRVSQGKGNKDRYAPLSTTLLEHLRIYWRHYQPTSWLFPGKKPGRPITDKAIQSICRPASKKAGISKPVTAHTLRHCFATHLLEAGVDLRTIQHLLGHKRLSTTGVYLHVARPAVGSSGTPFDLLATAADTGARS